MSVTETLSKWDLIISQVPYRRDYLKESKASIHLPVPHPDRTEDGENKHLVCPPITWADMDELMEYVRTNVR